MPPSPEADRDRDSDGQGPAKRRKVPRACDYCRKRKIRCDGPVRALSDPTSKCTHCTEMGLQCTYLQEASRKGPPRGYVVMLQERCARLENLVQQLRPGVDIELVVGPPLEYDTFDADAYKAQLSALEIPPFPGFKQYVAGAANLVTSPWALGPPTATPVQQHAPLSVYEAPVSDSLLRGGRSLVPDLASPTSDSSRGQDQDAPADSHDAGKLVTADTDSNQFYGRTATTRLTTSVVDDTELAGELDRIRSKRAKIWKTPEWEVCVNNTGQRLIDWTIWPDDDLAMMLIDSYFDWVNSVNPLLHRPLFRQQYFARLYMSDYDYAKMCLMVFANGSRFVYAPLAQWRRAQDSGHLRTDERPNDNCMYSDGWKFVRGLMSAGDILHKRPTLFRLQTAALLAQFMAGNTDQTLSWAISGAALHATQEVGLHVGSYSNSSSKKGDESSALERQLRLRAFWCLYHFDRSSCISLGRAVAIPDADIDASYPSAVDDDSGDEADEENPIPVHTSKITAFIHKVQLDRIISAALSVLPARRDAASGTATRLPAILIELAAALNKWQVGLPAALKWDPECRDPQQLMRIAVLHARFHWARIYVHYAPAAAAAVASGASGVAAFPPQAMLEICLESARSVFDVCTALLAHESFALSAKRPVPMEFIDYAWVAGAVSLIAIRGGTVPSESVEDVMNQVAVSVRTLQQMECVSRKAGQVADVLTAMARVTRPPPGAPPAQQAQATQTQTAQTQQATQMRIDYALGPATVDSTQYQLPQLQNHHQAQQIQPRATGPAAGPATPDLSWLGDPTVLFMPPMFDGSVQTPGSDVYGSMAADAGGDGVVRNGSISSGNGNGTTAGPARGTGVASAAALARRPGDEVWAHLLENFVTSLNPNQRV